MGREQGLGLPRKPQTHYEAPQSRHEASGPCTPSPVLPSEGPGGTSLMQPPTPPIYLQPPGTALKDAGTGKDCIPGCSETDPRPHACQSCAYSVTATYLKPRPWPPGAASAIPPQRAAPGTCSAVTRGDSLGRFSELVDGRGRVSAKFGGSPGKSFTTRSRECLTQPQGPHCHLLRPMSPAR